MSALRRRVVALALGWNLAMSALFACSTRVSIGALDDEDFTFVDAAPTNDSSSDDTVTVSTIDEDAGPDATDADSEPDPQINEHE